MRAVGPRATGAGARTANAGVRTALQRGGRWDRKRGLQDRGPRARAPGPQTRASGPRFFYWDGFLDSQSNLRFSSTTSTGRAIFPRAGAMALFSS